MSKLIEKVYKRLGVQGIEQKTLVKSAGSSFVIKIIGAGLAFVAQVVLARLLGVKEYGAYIYIYAWATIIIIPLRLGFDRGLVRFIPEYISSNSWAKLKGVLSFAYWSVFTISILATVLIILGLIFFRRYLNNYSMELIITGSLIIPFFSLLHITMNALQGFKKIVQAFVPKMVILQLVIIIGTYLLYLIENRSITAAGAMLVTLVGFLIALIAGLFFLKKSLPASLFGIKKQVQYKKWLSITLPLLFVAGMRIILARTDLIMIGAIKGEVPAGIYGAITKLSDLAVFGLLAINAIAAPLFSELYHSKHEIKLQKIVTLVARGGFVISVLVFVILIFFGKFILGLFGAAFAAGYNALLIILIAQMISTISGSVGFLLTMTGNQIIVSKILGLSAFVNILLNFLLIPWLGLIGAAIATGISIILWNLMMVISVKKNLKINATIFRQNN